jgi:hypothetical protein
VNKGSIGFLSCGALTSPRRKFIVNPKSFLISEVADLRPLAKLSRIASSWGRERS